MYSRMLWLPLTLCALAGARADVQRPEDVLLRALSKPFAPLQPFEEVSAQCREDSLFYLQQLNNYTSWALHMYDASTKIPSGLLTGNTQQLGNYDQCLAISVSRDSHRFQGQLCITTVQFAVGGFSNYTPEQNTSQTDDGAPGLRELLVAMARASDLGEWTGPRSAPYTWAFCVPSSCLAEDVEAALNHALLPLNKPGVSEVMVSVQQQNCYVDGGRPRLQFLDYCFIAVVTLFVSLVILSTVYEVVTLHHEKKSVQRKDRLRALLTSFSLCTNAKFLFSTKHGADTLACVDGFRFLSITWIIFGHSYYQIAITPQMNSIIIKYFHTEWSKMLIMNGTVSTDTFFVLSGMLLVFRFLRERQLNQPFSLMTFYLHRYVRLTPVYAMVIFFYATVFQYVGSGPLWNVWVHTNRDNCLDNWWTNLMYINNFVNVPNMCMSQSWYLAVDMQLLWLSPLVFIPLWKWRILGKVLFGMVLVASVIVPFVVTWLKQLAGAMFYTADQLVLPHVADSGLCTPTDGRLQIPVLVPFVVTWLKQLAGAMFYTGDSIAGVYLEVYIPVYCRGGSYLVGMALGYALFSTKGKKIKFTQLQIFLGWMIAVSMCLAVIFGILPMYQPEHPYNAIEAGIYAALHRCIWAAGISWVIFTCVHGYGGPVNSILSWPGFQPLSRLTYGAYLCHFIVLLYNSGSARVATYLSDYNVIHDFLGNLIIIFAIAVVVALLFELPFTSLSRVLLRPGASPTEKSASGVVGVSYTGTANEITSTSVQLETDDSADQACYDNEAFEDSRDKLHQSFSCPVLEPREETSSSSFPQALNDSEVRSVH